MVSIIRERWYLTHRIERFKLFLVLAFPIHLWVVLVGFQDLDYIISLNTPWDGIGFICYLLLYSLIDSIVIFLLITIISLMTPEAWSKEFRFVWLSGFGMMLTIFSVMEQYLIFEWFISFGFLQRMKWLSYPMWVGSVLVLFLLLTAWVVPRCLIQPNRWLQERLYSILEKLAVLAGFYIFLDLAAIIIIIMRNIN